ncbi:MAG: FHA domain-containing protein [Gammaproteobacteria bacterium]
MTLLVFELNDSGVIVADETGILLESPGYAIVEPDRTIVGEPALRAARLNPRWTNNRFWDELSLEPVAKPTAQIRSHADLAYAQLDDLRKALDAGDREAVFAVPGSFDNHQLALLLGITRECSLKAVGLVDAAVAAATQTHAGGDLLHLDLLLHRAVLTLIRRGEQLTRTGVEDIRQAGLAGLRERWVDLIADAYVSHTRFDPLHVAETEQALYDRLPAWLDELASADVTLLEMQAGPKTHRVSLTRESLLDRVRRQYDAIADQIRAALAGEPGTLLLTHRAARLPGLADTLAEAAGIAPIVLAPDAAARGVLAHVERIRSEGDAVSFVTALPAPPLSGRRNSQKAASATPAEVPARNEDIPDSRRKIRDVPISSPQRPTHLLYRSRAYAIGAVACRIGRGDSGLRVGDSLNGAETICTVYARGPRTVLENHGAEAAFVNDQRVEGKAHLALGDRVRIGSGRDDVLELIALVDRDGA